MEPIWVARLARDLPQKETRSETIHFEAMRRMDLSGFALTRYEQKRRFLL